MFMEETNYGIDENNDKNNRTVSIVTNEVGYEPSENQYQNEKLFELR